MIACFIVLSLIPPGQGGTEEAQKILDAYKQKLAAARTVSGVITSTNRMGDKVVREDKNTFQLQKPNLFAIKGAYEVVSDGNTGFMYMVSEKQYMKIPTAGTEMIGSLTIGFEPFFEQKSRFEISKVGMGTFKGHPAAEVIYKLPGSNVGLSFYVGKDSELPLGYYVKGGESTTTASYTDIKLDETFAEGTFKWSPPEGATEMQVGGGAQDYEKNMIKVGAKAPDFTIKNTKGANLNLAKSLKGSKGMLINFWFYG